MLVCLSSSPIIRHKFRLFISDFLISFITTRSTIGALGLSAAVSVTVAVPVQFGFWLGLNREMQFLKIKNPARTGFLTITKT